MSEWHKLAHFLYGHGFWYADPLREIRGLTEEELFWVPDRNSFPILWHVGHIAHRERFHIGVFLQGLPGSIMPERYAVFGDTWCTPEELRGGIDSVEAVLRWMQEVREESHAYIASIDDAEWHRPLSTTGDELTLAHWLFVTVSHGAMHLGRIQLLRNLLRGVHDNAC